ncbi:MAG: ferritin-like protein [Chitinophagaceae bacterium]|nr:ferritin-like protein [Chitinophagaceae bacterium]
MTLLTEACELEHGLACSYLYAAFSLKQDLSEGGMEWQQLHKVKKWAAQLYLVASQEMFHLSQAWNLLNAIGGSPYYLRPNFPQKSNYYPIHLPLMLEPFGIESMKRFIMYELPAHMDEKHYVKSELGYRSEDLYEYKTVGELYKLVRDGFEELPERELFIGDTRLQMGEELIDFPEIVKVVSRETAVSAIEKIMEQGEGSSSQNVEDSHYGIFRQVLREFEEEQQISGSRFQPVRPAISNPVVHIKGDYRADRGNYITNEYTAEVADLFDDIYNLMLRCLHFLFSTPCQNAERQRKLAKFSIAVMPMVVKPLGDALMLLPAGRLYPGKVAGPAFSMSRHVVLPCGEETAYSIIGERYNELMSRANALISHPQAPLILQAVSINLQRLKSYLE